MNLIEDATSKSIIFVCGLHRSGTSLLHTLLKTHPDISGFSDTGVPKDEGQHLQTIYPPAKVFGGSGRFGFNPESFMNEHHALVSDENAQRLLKEWGQYWDLSKPNLVEKSPPNLVRMRFLQALFPTSKFIIILRHPVAVAYATKAKFYKKGKIDELIDHWVICHQRFILDLPSIRSSHIVRYEDLVSDCNSQMKKMFQMLDVHPYTIEQHVSTTENIKYYEKWELEKSDILLGKTSELQKWSDFAKKFGYSITNPNNLKSFFSLDL